jgi:hypothetical protein
LQNLAGEMMKKYKALRFFALIISVVVLFRHIPAISSTVSIEAKYEVVAKGFRVGNIITSQ